MHRYIRTGITVIIALFLVSVSISRAIEGSPKKQQLLTIETACVNGEPQATASWRRLKNSFKHSLYRKPLGTKWSELANNLMTTSYVDTAFTNGPGTYMYQLQSFNVFGNSIANSDIVSVVIPSCEDSPAEENDTPTMPDEPDETPPDEAPLVITITSPDPGAVVSGDINVSAYASNNALVAGITFLVDGTEVMPEDTSAPYEFIWDTTSVPDTNHMLSVKARPIEGSETASAEIMVIVANSTEEQEDLVQNSSLELANANGDPEYWLRGGWGNNTRIYRYPVAGFDDESGAKVEITSYTDGDAKWYFKDVNITPNTTYTLTHAYKSSTVTNMFARFQTPVGYVYKPMGSLPASDTWQTSTVDITTPSDASSMTFFHALMSVGSLTIDSFALRPKASTTATVPATTARYVMLNSITWGANPLQNLPLEDVTEATYFVLPVNAAGDLVGSNSTLEKKFIADVHAKGKKATLSIAGGAQSVADITSAVTKNRTTFINNIDAHLKQFGYDGVIIDIENTELPSSAIPELINQLRTKIGPVPIIGLYVQHWQIKTVYDRLDEAADAVTWIAPMIYDFSYTLTDLKSLILEWLPKVKENRSKLLAGVAVNYPTGLSVEQYTTILKWVDEQDLGGIGIWENTIFTKPWIDAQRAVWPDVQ